jgi:hypothetical protein
VETSVPASNLWGMSALLTIILSGALSVAPSTMVYQMMGTRFLFVGCYCVVWRSFVVLWYGLLLRPRPGYIGRSVAGLGYVSIGEVEENTASNSAIQ